MTLSDFVRDIRNAIAPKPQVPVYRPPAYVMPVPVRVAPAPVVVPAQPSPSGDHGSLVSSSAHTHSLDKAGLISGK